MLQNKVVNYVLRCRFSHIQNKKNLFSWPTVSTAELDRLKQNYLFGLEFSN
jgi:hypothetical protein